MDFQTHGRTLPRLRDRLQRAPCAAMCDEKWHRHDACPSLEAEHAQAAEDLQTLYKLPRAFSVQRLCCHETNQREEALQSAAAAQGHPSYARAHQQRVECTAELEPWCSADQHLAPWNSKLTCGQNQDEHSADVPSRPKQNEKHNSLRWRAAASAN